MFRFHEDGTEARDGSVGIILRNIFPGILWKKAHGKLSQGEMKVPFGGFVEDSLGKG
jgi:hypothetical protein